MKPKIINNGLNYPNRKIVSTVAGADFATIEDCITWYNNNATEAVIVDLPDTNYTCKDINITNSHNILFRGWTGITNITFDTTGTYMFNCGNQREITAFQEITFNGDEVIQSGTAIIANGYVAIEGCEFNYFDIGVLKQSTATLWCCNSIFYSCDRATLLENEGLADLEINTFENCIEAISLTGGGSPTLEIQIMQNIFKECECCLCLNEPGFSNIYPSSIKNNSWDLQGTFFESFNFNTDSVNVHCDNNVGVESKKPHFKINVTGNTTSQILTSNTWTKATFTNTESYANKCLIANNKVTILEKGEKDMMMWVSGTLLTSTSTSTIRGIIVKNGNPANVGIMEIFLDQNNRAFNFSANVYLPNVNSSTLDYFEIYLYAVGSNETITLQNLNWLGTTI